MSENKHYIQTDAQSRIVSGWSEMVFPNLDITNAILLHEGGGYQFSLEPGGEENPVLTNPDGTHRYIYDASLSPAYREATAEELAAEKAGIEAAREPPGLTAAEEKELDMVQEIVEMRAQLAQLQINGGI